MQSVTFRDGLVAAAAVLLMIPAAGCGKAENSATPPPTSRTPPPPAVQAPRRADPDRKVAGGGKRPVAKATKNKSPESAPWPDGVDRENVFQAFPEPAGNYVIGDASGGPHPNDWFVAVLPSENADASSFIARAPDWQDERSMATPQSLPSGFVAITSAGLSPDGWPRRIRCEADGAEMVFIPGGSFVQGIDGRDANAGPAHPAVVDSFYIDVMEVSLKPYRQWLDEGGDSAKRPPRPPFNDRDAADHPALGIPWGDARAYAAWSKKSLPTESEWELASRGPRSFEHPWGNGRAVWNGSRKPGQIDAVGTHPQDRSVYDVWDMAGNAREWVGDFYQAKAYERTKAADGSLIRNWTGPKRPSPANSKVVKGGGTTWTLWHRSPGSMRGPDPDIGFRCVLRLTAGSDVSTPERPGPRRPLQR